MAARLTLTRSQILAFRRRAGSLDERLPWGRESLRVAACAGLQDSMPRAALLSIHARLRDTRSNALDDTFFVKNWGVQVWGPRFSVYVVDARDHAFFTLGRSPDDEKARRRALELAERLDALLDGGAMLHGEAERALGLVSNQLRHATTTGRVLIEWDGARQPTVRTVPAPAMQPEEARRELVRRYLHVYGPSTPTAFSEWAGIRNPTKSGSAAFDLLGNSLTPVRTPIGDAWILSEDEPAFLAGETSPAPARLLPSGDAYYLLQGEQRELLVPDAALRDRLWTPRVWPGAVLVAGEIAGTWRRAGHTLTISPWRRLAAAERNAVEEEAAALPLPGIDREIVTRWEE